MTRTSVIAISSVHRAQDPLREATNLVELLGALLASPDAETCVDGMHQVVLEVRARLIRIEEHLECSLTEGKR